MRAAFKTATSSFPSQGNRELPVSWDFTNAASIVDDLSPEMQGSQIEIIQSVFIDNSANPNTLTLSFTGGGNNQNIVAQPNTQGIYPVIAWGLIRYTVSTVQGVKVNAIFSNVAKPFAVWGPTSGGSAGGIVTGSYTDRSGSIAAGGVSQQLAAANLNRKRITIENPASAAGQGIAAAESLFINFGAAAGINNATSIELTPGGSFDSGAGPVSTQQINVNATTVGHQFIAKEM